MKRSLGSLAVTALVAAGVMIASPASATNNGGYLVCSAHHAVAATSVTAGQWTLNVPGYPYHSGYNSRKTTHWAYGSSQVGYWAASGTTLYSSNGFCWI